MFKQNDDHEFDASPKLNLKPARHPHNRLVCAACGHDVTEDTAAIEVSGNHTHTCTNPEGITFRIGCFAYAAGCRMAGSTTFAHTWFAGYQWRHALCDRCQTHLGWQFIGAENKFFGLILNRLVARERL